MASLTLYNFIVHNLLQINLRSLLVFHCWQLPVLLPMSKLCSENLIYSQYINLNNSKMLLANIHKDYLDSNLPKLGVFMDVNCEHSSFMLQQASESRLYTQHLHWLIYDEVGNMNTLIEHFENANLSLNADITYVKSKAVNSQVSLFTLYDVYNKGSHVGGQLNITIDQSVYCNRSQCAIKAYLSDLHKRTRLQQRSDLSGLTLRQVALITTQSLNTSKTKLLEFLRSEGSVHLDWTSRLGFRNNLHLQELLQFNINYSWQDAWSTNETIGGVIGELGAGNADLTTTGLVLNAARLAVIYPIGALSHFRSVCIFRTPRNAEIKTFVFLEPFRPSVWLVFGAMLILSGVLLWLTFWLETRWMQHCLQRMPSLLSSCLISFGSACIQGSHMIPRSTGGRLVFMAIMLTSFIMYNYYTSIVVAILLGSPTHSNIKTIQQLADSSLDVSFEDIPYNWAYIYNYPRTDIRNLFKRKVQGRDPATIWLSAPAGVKRVRDHPGHVFVSEASNIYNFIERTYLPHEICELNEIKFRPENVLNAVIPRNSTYQELFKQIQLRMLESGMTRKHREFYTKSKLHCFANNNVINVGMEYAAPLFIALVLAYSIALLLFLTELAWARYKRSST